MYIDPTAPDLFGPDDSVTGSGDPPRLPLAFALRKRRGLEFGDQSVLPQATAAAASVPADPVQQGRVLPNAARASNLGGLAAGYDTQIANYQQQLAELNKDPDYTDMAAAARTRGGQGVQVLGAALAAGMGPKDMQGLQGQFAQQSAHMMQPQKVEGGEIDVSGQVHLDPGYKRQKQIENLRESISTLEKQKLTAVTAEEKMRAEAMQRDQMYELRRLQVEAQREAARDRAANQQALLELKREGSGSKMQAHGVSPTGEIVSYNPSSGRLYVTNPDTGNVGEYRGPVVSQATADKNVMEGTKRVGNISRLDSLEQRVKDNPDVFGNVTSLASLTPSFVQSRINQANLTAPQRQILADTMRDSAQIINELYGAALSAGENRRASGFLPGPEDDSPTVLTKLASARQFEQSKLNELGPWGRQAQKLSTPAKAPALALPTVGDIVDGHRFKGGDPKQPTSWERAQ